MGVAAHPSKRAEEMALAREITGDHRRSRDIALARGAAGAPDYAVAEVVHEHPNPTPTNTPTPTPTLTLTLALTLTRTRTRTRTLDV